MICTIPRRGVDIILVFPHFREAIDSELASPTPAMKLGMVVVAEGYLTANIAEGLKTPKAAKPSDRSRLRRVTLAEYLRAWTAVDERERLAFDLVTFCGLRESEVYGLKIGDLFQRGAIKVQRSWYAGEVNPTKTNQIRDVGVELEIFERLMAWIANLPDRSDEGWVFASERIVTPLPPENVLQHCIHPRLDPLGLGWITFAVLRRSHSTLHQERGTDPKITADQQGHGLGVHLSDYVDSSLARKQEASSVLWADFKALQSVPAPGNLSCGRLSIGQLPRSGQTAAACPHMTPAIPRYACNCSKHCFRNSNTSPGAVAPSSGSINTPAGENCAPRLRLTRFIRRAGSMWVSGWNFTLSRV